MMENCERFTYGRATIPQSKKKTLFDQYLQVFEKPTIIYKTLGLRHKMLPLFLNRNLSYMHYCRKKKPRKNSRRNFKVDNILNQVLHKKNIEPLMKDGYILISAIEFCNPTADEDFKTAIVQVYLLNRGVQNVTSSCINSSGKLFVGSFIKVPVVKSFPNQATVTNITLSLNMAKFYKNFFQTKEWTFCFEVVKADDKFVGVLPLISASQCYNLVTGVYEIPLCTVGNFKRTSRDSTNAMQFLKVKLAWTKDPIPIAAITKKDLIEPSVQHPKVNDSEESTMKTDVRQIQYTFVWGPKSENQCSSLHPASVCPWCDLTLSRFYAMMKHLTLCHSRLNFFFKDEESEPGYFVVEVSLNTSYDGSYEGNAWYLLAQPNEVFKGPQNRSSFSELLMWKKFPKPYPTRNEFQPTKTPVVQKHPHRIGHNRVYYHFGSWLPYVSPKELETESDNEGLDWYPENSRREMNDFTDVNEGEKAVMNEWNFFVSVHFKILAVNHVVPACQKFIQQCGPRLLNKGLYRNLVLHFVCLHDFGVLSAADLYRLILELQQLESANDCEEESDAMDIDSMFDQENQFQYQCPNTEEELVTTVQQLESINDHEQESDAMDIDSMFDQENLFQHQGPNTKEELVTTGFDQNITEGRKPVALTPNTHATNKKDSIHTWESAYRYWLMKSSKEL